jgi:dihydroflavonol-4-reductase
LVTGGNGFVGCHVVRALLARGDRVRVLVRENADLSALAGLPVEIVRGDLRYFDSVERAVKGCEEVYHVAADYRLWLTDSAPMYATNVTGTRYVIRAAVSAGVSRIVHTSTAERDARTRRRRSPTCRVTTSDRSTWLSRRRWKPRARARRW